MAIRQYETRFFVTTFDDDWDGDFRREICVATARYSANGDLAAHKHIGSLSAEIGSHWSETYRIINGVPERTTTKERAAQRLVEGRRWAR